MKSINQSAQNLLKKSWLAIEKLNLMWLVAVIMIIVVILSGIRIYWRQKLINESLRQQIIAFQNELSECQQQTKIYIIYSGPEYTNEKYGFAMNIPKDWFVIEKEDSNIGEQFITFSNYKNITSFNKLNAPEDLLAYFILIYPKQNQELFKRYEEELTNRKQAFSEKIEYDAGKNKKITFYIISQSIDAWPATLDMTLPDAEAFLEDEAYGYYFYNATEMPSGKEGQKEEIEIMKKSLESFKFYE